MVERVIKNLKRKVTFFGGGCVCGKLIGDEWDCRWFAKGFMDRDQRLLFMLLQLELTHACQPSRAIDRMLRLFG